MPYTFLNLTGKPGLDGSDSKLMRAHVTRSNFARRRREISKRVLQGRRPERHILHEQENRAAPYDTDTYTNGLMLSRPTDPNTSVLFLLHEYHPLVFPAGTEYAGGPSETSWVGLMLSEPALLEASMAISLRHRSGVLATRMSDLCTYRAVRMVNKRLDGTPETLTDGLIAAVFTLSYSEKNEVARSVHVDGLERMIILKRSQGPSTISPWLKDFFLHDCIAKVLSPSEGHHEKMVDAIGDATAKAQVAAIAGISQQIAKLRHSLDIFYAYPTDSSFVTQEIDRSAASILNTLESLPGTEQVSYLSLLSRAIRIFICLSWPPSSNTPPVDLADELKDALRKTKIRLCSSTNLTVWQFFVGATAADLGSETRTWYLHKLKQILASMQVFDWQAVIVVLEKGFMPSTSLLEDFKHVWEETRIYTNG